MRTDVKIGVAVGLLFVIAVGSYYAIFDRSDKADPNSLGPEVARTDGSDRPGAGREGPDSGSEGMVLPRFGGVSGRPASPRMGERDSGGLGGSPPSETPELPTTPELPISPTESPVVVSDIVQSPTSPEAGVTPTAPESPDVPGTGETPTAPESPLVASRIRELPTVREPLVTPTLPPGPPAITPGVGGAPAGLERTYVVQKGDAGFWAVAEKVYGDGRLWTLIAKANPEADSNALRPGKKLNVPPKPVVRPGATGDEAAGGLIVTPTGQREYIVKKGDAGFWGIAQAVYGNGKHWALIAKANPQANSNSLKPGDKLAIPAEPAPASATPATPEPRIVLAPGQKLYVVEKSDTTGFWGIARKVYGNGQCWPVIAEANPRANSASLHVGQQLIVPELTAEMRRAVERAPATSTTPRPPAKDVEDIGRQPVFN